MIAFFYDTDDTFMLAFFHDKLILQAYDWNIS